MAVIASTAKQSSVLIKRAFWIALKDSDPLWAQSPYLKTQGQHVSKIPLSRSGINPIAFHAVF
jgi:hypothetical protein